MKKSMKPTVKKVPMPTLKAAKAVKAMPWSSQDKPMKRGAKK